MRITQLTLITEDSPARVAKVLEEQELATVEYQCTPTTVPSDEIAGHHRPATCVDVQVHPDGSGLEDLVAHLQKHLL